MGAVLVVHAALPCVFVPAVAFSWAHAWGVCVLFVAGYEVAHGRTSVVWVEVSLWFGVPSPTV